MQGHDQCKLLIYVEDVITLKWMVDMMLIDQHVLYMIVLFNHVSILRLSECVDIINLLMLGRRIQMSVSK